MPPRGDRYRMAELGGRDMAIDPVCNMEIDEKDADFTTEYDGKTYYFCSDPAKRSLRAIRKSMSQPRNSKTMSREREDFMAKVKQLTVAVETRPGSLAQVAKTLADAKVNIVALLGGGARLCTGGGGRPEQG